MQSSKGRARQAPRPRSTWRRLICHFFVLMLDIGAGVADWDWLAFLKQVRKDKGLHEIAQAVVLFAAGLRNRRKRLAVAKGHAATQAVGGELFDEGHVEGVDVFEQQVL